MVLVLSHSRTGSTAALRDAVLAGIADAGVDGEGDGAGDGGVRSLDVAEAGLDDVLSCRALVLCTPARFGALAGLTKDFLERIYPWFDEVPDVRPGLPYALVVRGASDASGAVRDVERIVTGLRWRAVVAPVVAEGPSVTDAHLAAARELGATVAAGVDAGLW